MLGGSKAGQNVARVGEGVGRQVWARASEVQVIEVLPLTGVGVGGGATVPVQVSQISKRARGPGWLKQIQEALCGGDEKAG